MTEKMKEKEKIINLRVSEALFDLIEKERVSGLYTVTRAEFLRRVLLTHFQPEIKTN
jgi:hypothetical protein